MKTAHAGLHTVNPAQSTSQLTPGNRSPKHPSRCTIKRVPLGFGNHLAGNHHTSHTHPGHPGKSIASRIIGSKSIWFSCCLVISLLSAILTAPAVKVQAEAQTDADAVQQLSGAGQEILAAINQHRVNAGLNALVVDPLLNQAAQHHVNDMLANYNYSHRGSDGSTVKMRVARTGYAADPWVSENWVSSRSTEGAMRWWMNDYIHRVNILTPHWREIGVGIASRANGEMIFVTVFATGRGEPSVEPSVAPAAQPAPAPAPTPTPAPLPQVDVPPGGMDYSIRAGDTLLGIANRHNVDWRVVAVANNLTEQSILQIGQVIRLPGVESAPATHFDDDGTTGSTASTEDALGGDDGNFEQSSAPASPPIETQPYTVQQGDTLFSIAARHGMTWEDLAELNNFREQDFLQIGQSLQVPLRQSNGNGNGNGGDNANGVTEASAANNESNDAGSTASAVNNSPLNNGTNNGTNNDTTNGANYVTREYTPMVLVAPANGTHGENSADSPVEQAPTNHNQENDVVAASFEQTGGDVASAQQPDAIAATAQSQAQNPPAEPAPQPEIHYVQEGETISSIAIQHGVDWQTLLSVNGLNEQSILQPGQEIRLP